MLLYSTVLHSYNRNKLDQLFAFSEKTLTVCVLTSSLALVQRATFARVSHCSKRDCGISHPHALYYTISKRTIMRSSRSNRMSSPCVFLYTAPKTLRSGLLLPCFIIVRAENTLTRLFSARYPRVLVYHLTILCYRTNWRAKVPRQAKCVAHYL